LRPRLSPTEEKVLRLTCQGLADKEIAARLGINCATVRTHIARMHVKLGTANRAQLGAVGAAWLHPEAGQSGEGNPSADSN